MTSDFRPLRIELPRLIGTRLSASRLVDQLFADREMLSGAGVVISGLHTLVATEEFIDELLRVLDDADALRVVLFGLPDDVEAFARKAIARRQLTNVGITKTGDEAMAYLGDPEAIAYLNNEPPPGKSSRADG